MKITTYVHIVALVSRLPLTFMNGRVSQYKSGSPQFITDSLFFSPFFAAVKSAMSPPVSLSFSSLTESVMVGALVEGREE